MFWLASEFPFRRIGVRAQSTLGGKTFFPEKYVWKINKMPEFYVIVARKIINIPEFLWYLPEKLTKFPNFTWFLLKTPEFYIIIAWKIFSRIWAPSPSVSYAHVHLINRDKNNYCEYDISWEWQASVYKSTTIVRRTKCYFCSLHCNWTKQSKLLVGDVYHAHTVMWEL